MKLFLIIEEKGKLRLKIKDICQKLSY